MLCSSVALSKLLISEWSCNVSYIILAAMKSQTIDLQLVQFNLFASIFLFLYLDAPFLFFNFKVSLLVQKKANVCGQNVFLSGTSFQIKTTQGTPVHSSTIMSSPQLKLNQLL